MKSVLCFDAPVVPCSRINCSLCVSVVLAFISIIKASKGMNAKALSLNCPVQVEGGRKASEKEQWGAQSSQGPHLLAPLSGSRWRKGESQQNRENKAHTLLYCRSAAKALPELPVPWKS